MRRTLSLTLPLALASLLGLSSSSFAQRPEHPWSIQGTAGVVFPTGEYAKATDQGFGFAFSLGYAIAPRWIALASFSAAFLAGDLGPDTNLYSYFLKAGYDIGDPGTKLRVLVPLGAGAVTFAPDSDLLSTKTYFALGSGMAFQYSLGPRVAFTADILVSLVFADERRLGSDSIWLFPLGAGLLVRF